MFDPVKLLGEMMENQASPAATGRLDTALGRGGLSAPDSPLQQLLGGLGGGAGPGRVSPLGDGSPGLGGLIGNLVGAAQQAVGTTAQQVQANNPMAIGGLGALAGALLGGGRGAVGGGVMAVLGSLAYSALQRASQPEAAEAASAGTGGVPVSQAIVGGSKDVQGTAILLLRAMISAAKADGQIDQGEMDRILGKLSEAGSGSEARDFVLSEMRGPLDLDRLVAEVKTPQQAAQVYAASLLAIDVDTPAEKAYLDRLAQALKLPPQVTAHIHDSLGVPA